MPPPPAASFPGPDALGRGAVVAPRQPTPPAMEGAPRYVIDDDVATAPHALAGVLQLHWVRRERFVLELATDNEALRAPQTEERPPHALPAGFAFAREQLHALIWANTYDCRGGAPIWWHGVLAERRGGLDRSDRADVELPDGRHAWCDGGPRGPVDGVDAPLIHRESIQLGRVEPLGASTPTEALAPDQLAAVSHAQGPARIVAPAGSGKTRVLTARLRHLLRDRGYERQLVTAVAYNTRAANEMRERTADLGASIRTLHSLALWITGQDQRRQTLDEREVRSILDRLLTVARIPNQDPFQPYLEALSEARIALRDPETIEASRDDVPGFAEMLPRYRAELERRNALDFDEQIYRALELLLTRPDIRATAQRACTHLLVDEFQDLTPSFLLLVRLVSAPSWQVFGVGDDDQTIYSHAGASPIYLIDFERFFPGAHTHPLEVNYRCPPAVVDAAVTLLGHNRRRVAKSIRAAEGAA